MRRTQTLLSLLLASACQPGAGLPEVDSSALTTIALDGTVVDITAVDGALYLLLSSPDVGGTTAPMRTVVRRAEDGSFEPLLGIEEALGSRLIPTTSGICVAPEYEEDGPVLCLDDGAWTERDVSWDELDRLSDGVGVVVPEGFRWMGAANGVAPSGRGAGYELGALVNDCSGGCGKLTFFYVVESADMDEYHPAVAELHGVGVYDIAITRATGSEPEMVWFLGNRDDDLTVRLLRMPASAVLELAAP